MTYKGIVRGKIIELEDKVALPEGSLVEVSIKEGPGEGLAPTSHPKGSSQAMLAALDAAPRCTTEDVEALLREIHLGKRPVRFEGLFDKDKEIGLR